VELQVNLEAGFVSSLSSLKKSAMRFEKIADGVIPKSIRTKVSSLLSPNSMEIAIKNSEYRELRYINEKIFSFIYLNM
jgi:hypothetical protein